MQRVENEDSSKETLWNYANKDEKLYRIHMDTQETNAYDILCKICISTLILPINNYYNVYLHIYRFYVIPKPELSSKVTSKEKLCASTMYVNHDIVPTDACDCIPSIVVIHLYESYKSLDARTTFQEEFCIKQGSIVVLLDLAFH